MKPRLAVPLLLTLLVCGTPLAFEGRVVGPDGEPLAGARVAVLGGRGSAVADATGRFLLSPDPPVPFSLLVSRPDGVALRPIRVHELPVTGPLELRLEPYLTQSVMVLSDAPVDVEVPPAAAFTLVGRADLEQRRPQTLADVLSNVPAASRLEEGASAVPALRGLPRSRTLLLLDEGRVTAERRAGPSATFLDPLTIEEVEVIRGPGAVAYGSDAFGGVVRGRTRIPDGSDPFAIRFGADMATLGEDTFAGDLEVAGPLLGGGAMIGGSARRLDDYESSEGAVDNSSARFSGARAGWQAPVLGGSLRVLWREDRGRDIGKPSIDSDEVRSYYPEENSSRGSAQYERGGLGPWSRFSVAVAWDRYTLLTERDQYETESEPRKDTLADVAAKDWGLRSEAERAIGPARLVLGLDASGRYGLHATNLTTSYTLDGSVAEEELEVAVESARREDLGAFASVAAPAGRTRLSAGLRLDRVASRNEGGVFGNRETSATEPSGFAAVGAPLGGGLDLTLQVARGFRDPLLSDRYYVGISGRGFVTGNPDLEPETSLQIDAAARWRSGPARIDAYAYRYRIRDLIERYREDGDYFFRNRGEAEIRGIEIEGGYAWPRIGAIEAGLSALRGEVLDDGTPTTDIPPRGGFVQFRRDADGRWWWLSRVAAYARDERPGPTETIVPGYAVVDAGAGFRLRDAIEIRVYGRNLLDHAYRATADEKAVLAPGRTVELTVRGVLGPRRDG